MAIYNENGIEVDVFGTPLPQTSNAMLFASRGNDFEKNAYAPSVLAKATTGQPDAFEEGLKKEMGPMYSANNGAYRDEGKITPFNKGSAISYSTSPSAPSQTGASTLAYANNQNASKGEFLPSLPGEGMLGTTGYASYIGKDGKPVYIPQSGIKNQTSGMQYQQGATVNKDEINPILANALMLARQSVVSPTDSIGELVAKRKNSNIANLVANMAGQSMQDERSREQFATSEANRFAMNDKTYAQRMAEDAARAAMSQKNAIELSGIRDKAERNAMIEKFKLQEKSQAAQNKFISDQNNINRSEALARAIAIQEMKDKAMADRQSKEHEFKLNN